MITHNIIFCYENPGLEKDMWSVIESGYRVINCVIMMCCVAGVESTSKHQCAPRSKHAFKRGHACRLPDCVCPEVNPGLEREF